MKHFMIKYRFANGTTEGWHREITRFVAALDNDPELSGRIIYRCLRNREIPAIGTSPRRPTTPRSRRCRRGISSSTIRK